MVHRHCVCILVPSQHFPSRIAPNIPPSGGRLIPPRADPLKIHSPELKSILHLGHILRGALPRTDFSGPTDPAWREGENVVVKARREGRGVHDWYWISGQEPDEVVLLKLFDSEELDGEGRPRCTQTPHASFSLEGIDEVLEPRESVEVRVVVC